MPTQAQSSEARPSRANRKTGLRRWLRLTLRPVHIVGVTGLVGASIYGVDQAHAKSWLIVTITSGMALVATDLYAKRPYLREVRGVAIIVKLACLIGIWLMHDRVVPLLCVIVWSTVVSHMPGRYRHWPNVRDGD